MPIKVRELVAQLAEGRKTGMPGEPRVNLLALNLGPNHVGR